MRMIPCMAGCAGPRFTKRCWLPSSAVPAVASLRISSRVVRSGISVSLVSSERLGLACRFPRVGIAYRSFPLHFQIRSPRLRLGSHHGPDERLASVDRVVLAQRMPDELLVEQEPPQVGMAGEPDAEHVPDLAL